jgi:hypothetical protein
MNYLKEKPLFILGFNDIIYMLASNHCDSVIFIVLLLVTTRQARYIYTLEMFYYKQKQRHNLLLFIIQTFF